MMFVQKSIWKILGACGLEIFGKCIGLSKYLSLIAEKPLGIWEKFSCLKNFSFRKLSIIHRRKDIAILVRSHQDTVKNPAFHFTIISSWILLEIAGKLKTPGRNDSKKKFEIFNGILIRCAFHWRLAYSRKNFSSQICSRRVISRQHFTTKKKQDGRLAPAYFLRGLDKRADFKWDKISDFGNEKKPRIPENETKLPIPKMRQNRRFRKWDKTADSKNETKPPIPKMRQNRQFRKWDKTTSFENETTADFLKENKLLSKMFHW